MSWGIVASVGGSIIGGAIASSGSKSAAGSQAAASDRATEAQREIFDKQVELQEPWRQAGMAGMNRLGFLLGLSPNGFQGGGAAAGDLSPFIRQVAAGWNIDPGAVMQNPAAAAEVQKLAAQAAPTEGEQQIRNRLLPQFTNTTYQTVTNGSGENMSIDSIPTSTVNEAGLAAAIQAEIQRQRSAQVAAQQAQSQAGMDATNDQAYGSLMRPFTMKDYQADPGLAFRQSEGERGLTRGAAASGLLGSGKYLKDAMRFNQGLASQEYGAAYDRFNTNQANQFNRLASVAGIGQTAANQTGAAAAQFGSQIGSNIIGAGNARAAGQVGSANALNGAIGQGLSMYQQGQMMNRLFPQGGGGYGNGGIGYPSGMWRYDD